MLIQYGLRDPELALFQGESVCMSVCDTGSRLNCMALASYSGEKHETPTSATKVAGVKRKRKREKTGEVYVI